MTWLLLYWIVAAATFAVGLVFAWRQVVADDGDVGDLGSLAFIALGAGLLWPGLPLLYLAHVALTRAKAKKVAR